MRRDNVLTPLLVLLLAALLVGLPVRAAWAGGLWVYEHGTPEVGTANAGTAARAEDASTAANNPAGMARLEKPEVMVTLQPLVTDLQFRPGPGTTTNGPNGDGSLVLPTGGLFYVQPLGKDWRVGLSLGSYSGLGAKYEDDWVGRYYVQESVFLTLSAMPTISYRVTDWLSIGAGLMVQYAAMKAKLALNNTVFGSDGQMEYKGDSFGVGGSVGILVEPWKGTRFGLTYLSPVQHEFEDTPQFSNAISPINQTLAARTGQLQLKMTMPQQVMFSAYHEITPQWAVMGNLGWQNWTKFGYVGLSITSTATDATVSTNTNAQYDDTFHIAVGAHYRFHPQWRVTAGFAYDSSPVGDADRTVVLPLDRQFRYSAGLIYDLNERITMGLAYTFLDGGSASVNQTRGPLAGTLQGDFSSYFLHVIALNFALRF